MTSERAAPNPSTIDIEAGTVTRGDDTFTLSDYSDETQRALALIGLRQYTNTAKGDVRARLAAGDLGIGKRGRAATATTRLSKMDMQREAIAHAKAEAYARASGVRVSGGKPIEATREFQTGLESARTAVADWDKSKMRLAMTSPEVVAWHAKLTGVSVSVDALFAEPATAEDMSEAA